MDENRNADGEEGDFQIDHDDSDDDDDEDDDDAG